MEGRSESEGSSVLLPEDRVVSGGTERIRRVFRVSQSNQIVRVSAVPVATTTLQPVKWSLIWDAVLGVIAAAAFVAFFLLADLSSGVSDALAHQIAPSVLLATALNVSIRVGSANLAVQSISSGATLLVLMNNRFEVGAIVAVGTAAIVGILVALLVITLDIPGWMLSFGAIALVELLSLGFLDRVSNFGTGYSRFDYGWPIVGVAMLIAAGLGALLLLTGKSGRTWATIGPAIVGSYVLAAGAGVVQLQNSGYSAFSSFAGSWSRSGSVTALVAVLVGGTSPNGKRGGLLGPAFVASLLSLLFVFLEVSELLFIRSRGALASGVIGYNAVSAMLLLVALVVHGLLDLHHKGSLIGWQTE